MEDAILLAIVCTTGLGWRGLSIWQDHLRHRHQIENDQAREDRKAATTNRRNGTTEVIR